MTEERDLEFLNAAITEARAGLEAGGIPTGPSAGRTRVETGGKRIAAQDTADVPMYYDFLVALWARSP